MRKLPLSILLQNKTNKLKRSPNWNLKKANWDDFKTSCLTELIPEANKNKEEDLLYFANTLLNIAERHIPKSSTTPKHNRPWFSDECQNVMRLRRAALKKSKINPTRENINNYKNSRAKAREIIKNSNMTTWKNYVAQIKIARKVWQMIRKITGKKATLLPNIIHNNVKITD